MKVSLIHIKGVIDDSEIEEVEAILKTNNIELATYDRSGHPEMCLTEIVSQIYIYLSPAIVIGIATGVLGNATYDALKFCIMKFTSGVKGKTFFKVEARKEPKEIPAEFGVKFKSGDKEFDLKMSSSFSDETQKKCIEEAFNIIKKNGPEKELDSKNMGKNKYVGTFDEKKGNWIFRDVFELIKSRKSKNK